MATFFGSTRWGGTSATPAINITGEYDIGTRTSTTVQVRLKITVSTVTGASSYGYTITERATMPGVDSGVVTVKNASPSQWSSPYVTYFPSSTGWYTVSQAATNTSFTASITMGSTSTNSARKQTLSGTISFPIGNTAPYWNGGSRYLNYSGTVPENTGTVTATATGGKDDQGNAITYRYEWYANGSLARTYDTTATTDSFNFGSYGQGATLYCKISLRDAYTSFANASNTGTITKNRLTAAGFTGTAPSINFDTTSFVLQRGNALNTNGNTSFSYTLTGTQVPIYNTNVTSVGTSITVQVWRTGSYPSTPYIKFNELQSYLSSRSYNGNIQFILKSANNYGSSAQTARDVFADLRMSPTQSSIINVEGTYKINNVDYYVINRKAMSISWSTASDKNGTTITYTLQSSINNGAWANVVSGITAISCSYPIRNITSSENVKFRVVASTSYGYTSTSAETPVYTLHYYNPPVMSDLLIDRNTDACNLTWKYNKNSSIPNVLYQASFNVKNNDTGLSIIPTILKGDANNGVNSYEVTAVVPDLAETTTFPIRIECSDNLASLVFSLTPETIRGIISRYSALFTIREKGVGVNAVAGDFANFITKGTSAFYGGDGDIDGLSDGTLNFAVGGINDTSINYYLGAYLDAQGDLRAAYTSPPNTTNAFLQVQVYFNFTSPIRCRCFYPSSKTSVPKDVLISNYGNITYGAWSDLITPGNLPTAINALNKYKNKEILLWEGTLLGGTETTISSMSSYSKIHVYVNNYNICSDFYINLSYIPKTKPCFGGAYSGSSVISMMADIASRLEHHFCIAEVNSAKTVLYNRAIGYEMNNVQNLRNNHTFYYIYRVCGVTSSFD